MNPSGMADISELFLFKFFHCHTPACFGGGGCSQIFLPLLQLTILEVASLYQEYLLIVNKLNKT